MALGYGTGEAEGREADDLIAAKVEELKGNHELIIVSADKDLAQLIEPRSFSTATSPDSEPKTWLEMLDEKGVVEKFGVKSTQILDYLSIIGDQSDNIPGLQGVGPKTAVKWLQKHGEFRRTYRQCRQSNP